MHKKILLTGFVLLLAGTAYADDATKSINVNRVTSGSGTATSINYELKSDGLHMDWSANLGATRSGHLVGGYTFLEHGLLSRSDQGLGIELGNENAFREKNAQEKGVIWGLRAQSPTGHASLRYSVGLYSDFDNHVTFNGTGPELDYQHKMRNGEIHAHAERWNLQNPALGDGNLTDPWISNAATGRLTQVSLGGSTKIGENLKLKAEAVNTNMHATGIIYNNGSYQWKTIQSHQVGVNVGLSTAL